MARIAYVDHSYHQTTRSTDFLPELLQRHGHRVDRFWDEAWKGGAPVAWQQVADHDVVIMFQSYCPPEARHFRAAHPNVVYIPMLDQFGFWLGPMCNLSDFWEPFQGSKVLNFSSALHAVATGFGLASHFARYYPPIAPASGESPREGLHGFFWLRREGQLPWATVRRLIDGTRFESFHLHLATDPGTPGATLPSPEDMRRFRITTSTWFEHKADLEAVMARANVYFAPRPGEGIGQSFLEAMARGQCVVAPNQGTMNEYLLPGVNGLLYDLDDPRPLDFTEAARLGTAARESLRAGRLKWEADERALVDFVLAPSEQLYRGRYQHPIAAPQPAVADGTAPAAPAMLRTLAQRHPIFRHTRFLWHPLLRAARRRRGPG